MNMRPYTRLSLAITANFLIMWALTYVGVNQLSHIYLNLNRFYMAVVMAAPMLIVMLTAMWGMFPDKRVNAVIYAGAALIFLTAFWAIRAQALINDEQLSRSMIPHHSIAIKNCERAKLDDPESIRLCEQIIRSQREEIAQMQQILERLEQ